MVKVLKEEASLPGIAEILNIIELPWDQADVGEHRYYHLR